jgi:glycosyltransferase involved in cell wall biosynthesis
MQKLSIGIIGFNEEDGIGKLLESLQEQTLLKNSYDVEVIVVSNGSYDNMVAIAKEKLIPFDNLGVKTKVVELAIADKCAAWNHFIHEASAQADYYIVLDADVALVNKSGLEEMINILVAHPECRVCGGKIVGKKGDVIDRQVDGKCYAAPGDVLRNIAIPNGIVMDDAYIAITAVTNWYETDFEQGNKKGYVKQVDNITVSCGETARDKTDISYWLASRKRTITGGYVQKHVDYCMRNIFGGGESAKNISMKLFYSNPDWFLEYLKREDFKPDFNPPAISTLLSVKGILLYIIYCYCYGLSIKGIKEREFGHLAWKLKGRYW